LNLLLMMMMMMLLLLLLVLWLTNGCLPPLVSYLLPGNMNKK